MCCKIWPTLCLGIIILLVLCTCKSEGFESGQLKFAKQLSKKEPTYDGFQQRGLDGTQYYDAHRLWTSGQWTPPNIVKHVLSH